MTQMMRYLVLNVLGLALAVVGIFHATAAYPDPHVFAAVGRDLPMLGAVASFGLGVALALAGLILLVPFLFRLGRRRMAQTVPVHSNNVTPRPVPDRREDDFDFDPDADPYSFGSGVDDYDNRHPGDYGSHGGAASPYGPAPSRNGRPDRRPLMGARR